MYNLRRGDFGIIIDMRYASLLFAALAFTAGAMEKPAAGGTFVDFASAGPRYSISTGQFARPEDAARQLSVGPDGLTALVSLGSMFLLQMMLVLVKLLRRDLF